MAVVSTRILPKETIPLGQLTYVVIGARQGDRWIFVRHRDRNSWEMPAGHIEEGESADQAAVRELYEETGAVRSDLEHLCDYEVTMDGNTGYGRLYDAVVHEREEILAFEIVETRLFPELPEELTYPKVQFTLFERARQQLQP
jgi:8-oxo-dGTP diphosphatase